MNSQKYYICIDLKSFYASVECVERGLSPLDANLVVADEARTKKTVCLAVTPALKAYGISGRARLYEVIEKVRQINNTRKKSAPGLNFSEASIFASELNADPSLALDFIIAPPRMAYYIEYSTRIYEIYLKYFAHEDIHVYSVDEVFIDASSYLKAYNLTAYELAARVIDDVYRQTGITATAGVGTNLYLSKIAMDIIAKKMLPDKNGARIGELDEMSYRRLLWSHTPITDFWQVGKGIAQKLEDIGLYTMGDIAKCSVGKSDDYYNEDSIYKLLGVNAQLLIDHAWGWEPCTIADIRNYKPCDKSLSSGQVLKNPYKTDKAKLVIREMTELLCLELLEKGYLTNKMVLTVGYDIDNLSNEDIMKDYKGEISGDFYGRKVPKHAHGTGNLSFYTVSVKLIVDCVMELFDRIITPGLMIRRMTVSAINLKREDDIATDNPYVQLDFFSEGIDQTKRALDEDERQKKEKALQQAMLTIKKKYGKNSILKGMNFEDGATSKERNSQLGGHKA